MSFINEFFSIVLFTFRRLTAQRGMALAALTGIIAAEALAMSFPIYADTAYQKLLNTRIEETIAETNTSVSRPPFAMLFRYLGAWYESVKVDQLKTADTYLSGPAALEIGLPVRLTVRYLQADIFGLYPAKDSLYGEADKLMERVKISSLSGLEDHVRMVEGRFPTAGAPGDTGPVDVLVYEQLANQAGMQVGDVYSAQAQPSQAVKDQPPVMIPVRVAGIWRERDPQDDYWYYGPNAVEKDLLITESDLLERVAPRLGNRLYEVAWYWVLDGTHLQAAQAPTIIEHIERARTIATRLLPKATLEISPIQLLTEYQASARSLGLYLAVFSLPLLCMILIFISQTASTWVGQRRNEIATLRSRGVSVLQVAGIAVLENLLLGLVGLAAAAPLARGFVSLFCRATGFLQFSGQPTEIISTSQSGLQAGLAALGVIAVAQVIPTISAAHYSVISYKRERSRQLARPWWQRAWIDLLLLLPSGYGLYVLRQQGHLIPVDAGANPAGNSLPGLGASLFDPLLLLLPTLGIFALTLLLLRLLPYLMRAITWGCSRTSSVGLLMAVRSLARAPGDFHAPLILLVMTLSLSTFTASMAQTLDSHLRDMTDYLVGADMQLSTSTDQGSGSEYGELPISEYQAIPGVQSAAQVQGVDLSLQDVAGGKAVRYLGIDRVDFPGVAFWRADFAPQSLGAMMNALAQTPDGVFVSDDMADSYGFQVGDVLRARAFEAGQERMLSFQILGTFHYFPTWYPGGTPLLVGNLDNYAEQVGQEFPGSIWIRSARGPAGEAGLIAGAKSINKNILFAESAAQALRTERSRPERQGFFGLLSVGFAALGLLSALGFLLYALTSFRRRMVELGVLRAIGLSTGQMLSLLAAELTFLFGVGLAAGTGLGLWVSGQIIPLLQLEPQISTQVPPFQVEINWLSVFQIYSLFIALFAAAVILLMVLLVRMKIFQVIKLGETI